MRGREVARIPGDHEKFTGTQPWAVDSWKTRPNAQPIAYDDSTEVERAVATLRRFPPLVTSWEIEQLKSLIVDAQEGRRFLLQGGDCAETLADCVPDVITAKLKILLQMSLVLVHASKRPVVRVGRFAGQYAKPRSSLTESTRIGEQDVTLPSYFGDLVNSANFDVEARRPNPNRMVEGYAHAALTLNFIRSLMDAGFADLHHPEYWDLGFVSGAALPAELREEYQRTVASVSDGLRFTEALGERAISELYRAEFYTSHEGLNLLYESTQTRSVPRRAGVYDLTTHLPWIGERTRQLDGAHIEFFRGIANPVGVKIGPSIKADELTALVSTLNPTNAAGKIILITRFGAGHVHDVLPSLVEAIVTEGLRVLWICDPMHGNTIKTSGGIKTRPFDRILEELEATWDLHESLGSGLGGLHIELTGEDVTECLGGASGLVEEDLARNYASVCDPRLNYHQSLELAFLLAKRMRRTAA